MILSQSCEYGIRAVIYIAKNSTDDYISIGRISRDLDISFHFLTKILQKLSREKILVSSRGPAGGIRLAKQENMITVMEIITAIDGKRLFGDCVLGLAECNDAHPCPFHDTWVEHRKKLAREFRQINIGDLAEQTRINELRI